MRAKPVTLPVVNNCDGCGACCLVVTLPPFRREFEGGGEDAWQRLTWERPELCAALLAEERARRAASALDYGSPCLWYDASTRRCRHYEYRPRACREFQVGGIDCRDARRRSGIGEP
jgi:Fe-S-cluster containining protein